MPRQLKDKRFTQEAPPLSTNIASAVIMGNARVLKSTWLAMAPAFSGLAGAKTAHNSSSMEATILTWPDLSSAASNRSSRTRKLLRRGASASARWKKLEAGGQLPEKETIWTILVSRPWSSLAEKKNANMRRIGINALKINTAFCSSGSSWSTLAMSAHRLSKMAR